MRGEHQREAFRCGDGTGSSPLARGALVVHHVALVPVGIIPACAGSTLARAVVVHLADGIIPACAGSTGGREAARFGVWDHPRLRGEHSGWDTADACVVGSSPLARGARAEGGRRRERQGIIPACAGSTPSGPTCTCRCWDHPRLRGEHAVLLDNLPKATGSSPLARGAPDERRAARRRDGIIPACAGSTL